ncbi:MAG: N-acetylmuramic acid 6-phosphate etherase [Kiritimatiellae bacterium]|nr:N-acetylmuramic acid 6-phosphate etherase [Kiritimatiellia bacterium]
MLKTEMRNPRTTHLDRMTTAEMLRVIQDENMNAVRAVDGCLDAVGRAVDTATACLRKGGRLVYVGAGTSGRLGVLDASEACPTFGVPEGTIVGVMAGGVEALHRAGEPEEDSSEFGVRDLKAIGLAPADCVVGISAAGGAEYVLAAVEYAKSLGCATVGLTCNEGSPLAQLAGIAIVTDTGAEVVTGSTRMKAGTAHKLVLNMLSTCSMAHLGNVYENMMVNLKPTNAKLRERMVGIVADMRKVGRDEARTLLERAGWSIKGTLNGEMK